MWPRSRYTSVNAQSARVTRDAALTAHPMGDDMILAIKVNIPQLDTYQVSSFQQGVQLSLYSTLPGTLNALDTFWYAARCVCGSLATVTSV